MPTGIPSLAATRHVRFAVLQTGVWQVPMNGHYDETGQWVPDEGGRDWSNILGAPFLLVILPSAASVSIVLFAKGHV